MDKIGLEVKNLLIQYSIQAVMKKLIEISGFFAFPIVNPITSYIVTKLVTYLVEETSLGLSLLWITLEIQYSVDTVENATAALKEMLNDPSKYTADQQASLEATFDDDAVSLIRLSISKLHGSGP